MTKPAPGAAILLRILRAGCLFCAAIVALVMAIEVWKTWFVGVARQLTGTDYVFFAVLVVLLLGLLWLARSISQELRQSQGG